MQIPGSLSPYVPRLDGAAPSRAARSEGSAAPDSAAADTGPSASASSASTPSLWDMLTPDEQAFFSRQAQMGPLTYGRGGNSSAPATDAPVGQRVDVRA